MTPCSLPSTELCVKEVDHIYLVKTPKANKKKNCPSACPHLGGYLALSRLFCDTYIINQREDDHRPPHWRILLLSQNSTEDLMPRKKKCKNGQDSYTGKTPAVGICHPGPRCTNLKTSSVTSSHYKKGINPEEAQFGEGLPFYSTHRGSDPKEAASRNFLRRTEVSSRSRTIIT